MAGGRMKNIKDIIYEAIDSDTDFNIINNDNIKSIYSKMSISESEVPQN